MFTACVSIVGGECSKIGKFSTNNAARISGSTLHEKSLEFAAKIWELTLFRGK